MDGLQVTETTNSLHRTQSCLANSSQPEITRKTSLAKLHTMEVEKSILRSSNHRAQQSIAGKIVHFKPPEKIWAKLTEDQCPISRPIPLDVYGKPETYRWRTAYDEAYNVDNQVCWK
uniref:Testicular haploid expressed protein n=1 Tax=Pyxicephalus adspersus TaxID=30357 RepID=A0AAV2ZPJ7_PYXAD|nr:TPA: hypothetical protein GDO54_005407 [Pyxicephalus adspersus]